MENITLIASLLPTRKLLKESHPDLVIPRGYRGTNRNPYSVEMLSDVLDKTQKPLRELIENWNPASAPDGMDAGEAFLYHLGTDFYGVTGDKYAYFNYRIVNGSAKDLGEHLINFIYLEYFFPHRVAGIISLLTFLNNSTSVDYKLPNVPSRDELQNYMQVSAWVRNENIYVAEDVLWIFSKSWDVDKFLEIISMNAFTPDKLKKLFFLGVDSLEELYDMAVGKSLHIPEQWLDSMLEAAGWKGSK